MAPKVAAPGVFLQAPMVAGRPLVGAARFRPRAPREFRVVMQAVAVDTGIKKAVRPASLEEGELPMNTFKTKEPFVGEVVSVERIVGPNATGETCHVRIKTNGKIPFHEGQSYGVIPPGTKTNSRGKEVPHGVRLYTIASTRYGDDFDGQTASLCIRRATYKDPESGEEDAAKKGICSNFLCDAKKGMKVNMTGPSGKLLLLPEDKNAVLIMVATGTGIAPYRAFWRRAFLEDVSEYKFTGLQWLFMGCANNDAKLYDDEIQTCVENFPDQFRVDYALSREQKNKDGGKMYIQDRIEEYSDQIFDLLADGAHIYFCGLKGMMPGITEMLQRAAAARGLNFDDWLKNLKEAGTWHVEVY